MKKFLYIISASILTLTSCGGLFKADNQEGPNAQISGKLIDSETKELVATEYYETQISWNSVAPTSGFFTITELGWPAEEKQYWRVKWDGSYANNLIFAGKYKVEFNGLPVYNSADTEIEVGKGKNTKDFEVTPYCRISNVVISYEAATKKIKATCKVDLSQAGASQIQVRLCVNTDKFVGTKLNYAGSDAGAVATVNSGDNVTLYIDTTLPANASEFQYTRNHYLRIAAIAAIPENSSSLANFSKVYRMSSDFSKVEEVSFE